MVVTSTTVEPSRGARACVGIGLFVCPALSNTSQKGQDGFGGIFHERSKHFRSDLGII